MINWIKRKLRVRTRFIQAQQRATERRERERMLREWENLLASVSAKERHFLQQHVFRRHPKAVENSQNAIEHIVARQGRCVSDGPFQGMKYGQEAFFSAYAPKLLGCYEAELHGAIELLLQRKYQSVVDIGAAEGYYAIGMALRLPMAQIVAFEEDEHAQQLCLEMALLNGVADRVEVRATCTPPLLDQTLQPFAEAETLIICDVEGYESELMNPRSVPALTQCDLIIEMHDCLAPKVTSTLLERFAGTHNVQIIESVARKPQQVKAVQFLRACFAALGSR